MNKKLGPKQFYNQYKDKRFNYCNLADILCEYFDKVDLTQSWDKTIECYYIKAIYRTKSYQIYYRIELIPTDDGKNICIYRFTKYFGIENIIYYDLNI